MADPMMNGDATTTTDEWEEDNDSNEFSLELIRLARVHTEICDRILHTHTELNMWNNSDAEGKQEIQDKYVNDLK